MKFLAILVFIFITACQQINVTKSVVFDNNQLSNISSSSIKELRLLTPSEAAVLYGTGAGMGGAIDIKIR